MILQALTRYYEALLKRGDIAPLGWSKTKISFALCLDKDGHVTQVIPTMEPVEMGKKTVLRPQEKNFQRGRTDHQMWLQTFCGTIPVIFSALTKKANRNAAKSIFLRQKRCIMPFRME